MLKALCESRSTGSRVISDRRYLGQEGKMDLLGALDLLSGFLKCLDKMSQKYAAHAFIPSLLLWVYFNIEMLGSDKNDHRVFF